MRSVRGEDQSASEPLLVKKKMNIIKYLSLNCVGGKFSVISHRDFTVNAWGNFTGRFLAHWRSQGDIIKKNAIYIIADLLGWAASFFVLELYCYWCAVRRRENLWVLAVLWQHVRGTGDVRCSHLHIHYSRIEFTNPSSDEASDSDTNLILIVSIYRGAWSNIISVVARLELLVHSAHLVLLLWGTLTHMTQWKTYSMTMAWCSKAS